MFDNTDTPSLELLRFRHELTAAPGFEDVLRERVQRLSAFRHPAFSSVRALQHLEEGEGLTLVSVHTPGQRLSELFDQRPRKPLHPGTVTWLLRELTPALAALQSEGADVSHGAVTPDRIVLTAEGRLCIVEHVLGSALQHLDLPPARLWREFGLVSLPPEAEAAHLDARADVIQLASVALSMLLARPVTLDDVQTRLGTLLDEFSERTTRTSSHHVAPLRLWLERALQVNAPVYGSASDAEVDLKELPPHNRAAIIGSRRALTSAEIQGPEHSKAGDHQNGTERAYIQRVPSPEEPGAPPLPPDDVSDLTGYPSEVAPGSVPPRAAARPVQRAPLARETPFRGFVDGSTIARARDGLPTRPADPLARIPIPARQIKRHSLLRNVTLNVAAVLGVIALIEAAVIWYLAKRGPAAAVSAQVLIESPQAGATVLVNGQPAGATPFQLSVGSDVRSIRIGDSAPAVPPQGRAAASSSPGGGASDAREAAAVSAAPVSRQGGVQLVSPIELTVLQGERVLGSTAGPIFAPAGAQQLDLVNTALGYRARQTVTFPAGKIATVAVTVPNGSLSANAQPGWAELFIDQKKVGETPLANVSVTPGQHEILFRHPKLGEQRQTVVVSPDSVTRVTANFEK